MSVDINKLLFRASSMDALMVNDRSGKGMGETAKAKALELYLIAATGRTPEIASKYIEKGVKAEEDAISLVSLIENRWLSKNTERFKDSDFTGEPDVIVGSEIYDTKCSYSLFSVPLRETETKYKWQMMTYLALTGLERAHVCHCLVNMPIEMLERQYNIVERDFSLSDEDKVRRKMKIEANGIVDVERWREDYPDYQFYDFSLESIPLTFRYKKFTIERDEAAIELMRGRAQQAREFLAQLY